MAERGTAYDEIRVRAIDLVESQKVDPARDRDQTRSLVSRAVEDYQALASLGSGRSLGRPSEMVDRVLRSIADFGPLTDLFARDDIEEIFIEGPRVTYLDSGGRLRGLDEPTTEDENEHVVARLLSSGDRRIDASSPIVQARVLGGTARLTAVIPPVADQLSVTIRRYALRKETLSALVEMDSLSPAAGAFLAACMQTTSNLVVSGPPGAGKTSLLSALIGAAPPHHCIRCCEEVREIHVPLLHGSFYEARPPGLDGSGEITLRNLVKVILAMRPDRIVVGEVRGSEAFELTRAVNAGCGFACTVHANSAAEALVALVNAALMAGENVPEPVVRGVFSSSIDIVVHLDREPAGQNGGRRQVMEVLALVPALRDDFSVQPIFVRDRLGTPLRWTGALPPGRLLKRLESVTAGHGGIVGLLEGRSAEL